VSHIQFRAFAAAQRYHDPIGLTCQMCSCRYWRTVERRLMRYIAASLLHTLPCFAAHPSTLHSIPQHAHQHPHTHLYSKIT
jgi:hypothetical protein